jgi:hypothetical protein
MSLLLLFIDPTLSFAPIYPQTLHSLRCVVSRLVTAQMTKTAVVNHPHCHDYQTELAHPWYHCSHEMLRGVREEGDKEAVGDENGVRW